MAALGLILISGVLGVAGQLTLKWGMRAAGPLILRPDTALAVMLRLAFNPVVILGLAVYVTGTFFWLLALSQVDLSYAYPFASLNYVLIVLASWGLLGEHLTALRLIGVGAICLGVVAIARSPARTVDRQRNLARRPSTPMKSSS